MAERAIGDAGRQKHTLFGLMSMAFLVTGNVLGVGVLALIVLYVIAEEFHMGFTQVHGRTASHQAK